MDRAAMVEAILARRRRLREDRALLVAISGIDASGKGYVTAQVVRDLERRGVRVAGINIDGWLNLPGIRFNPAQPGEHFYHHAIRFDEMFEQLVLPLRDARSIRVEMDYAEETATQYRKQLCTFSHVDVIVVEGIFLLKREFRRLYDMTFWIDCTFDTALERAIARSQEGLGRDETIRAYQSIYFPAQMVHFSKDDPRSHADAVVPNDDRAVQLVTEWEYVA